MKQSTRRTIIAVSLAACGIGAYFALKRSDSASLSGADEGFTGWKPTERELISSIGAVGSDPPTAAGKEMRERFANAFKSKYRFHTPNMAVGMKFSSTGSLELSVPPRMEPWNVDRLAMEAWRESQTAFGHTFDVDVFVSFIGAKPIKVSELRNVPGDTRRVTIQHYPLPRVFLPAGYGVPKRGGQGAEDLLPPSMRGFLPRGTTR